MSEKFLSTNQSELTNEEQIIRTFGTMQVSDSDLINPEKKINKKEWGEDEILLAGEISSLIYENKDLADTALPLIKLHMFNFIRENPLADDDLVKYELSKIKRFSDIEKEYMNPNNPLPTVGIELEIPGSRIPEKMRDVLTLFKINFEDDAWGAFEINPRYAYSPWISGKMLQEIWRAGFIRNVRNLNQEPTPGDLSLHLNFGLPKGVEAQTINIQRITDLITYAFVSPERIENRKTRVSLMIKDEGTEASSKFNDDVSGKIHDSNKPLRIEIRPTEFKDKTAYRMITEAQLIMSLYISKLKKEQEFKITDAEKNLANLYKDFDAEIREVFRLYKLKPRLYDKNEKHTDVITLHPIKAEQIEPFYNATFVDKCRGIITEYARKASFIIKDDLNKDKKN